MVGEEALEVTELQKAGVEWSNSQEVGGSQKLRHLHSIRGHAEILPGKAMSGHTHDRPPPRRRGIGAVAAAVSFSACCSGFSAPASFASSRRTRSSASQADEGCSSIAEDDYKLPLAGALHRRRKNFFSCAVGGTSTDDLPTAQTSKYQAFRESGLSPRIGEGRMGSRVAGRYGGLICTSVDTALAVSRSENILGFKVEDFDPNEPFNPKKKNAISEEDLVFCFEDFEDYDRNIKSIEIDMKGATSVKTLDLNAASPMDKYVAAHVSKRINAKKRESPANRNNAIGVVKTRVPEWFPWIPTEEEILKLKVVNLRVACLDRGLTASGTKADLQQRLMSWATVQDRQRVKERLSGLKELLEASKSPNQQDVADVVEAYDVDALTSKRRALTKNEKRSKHRDAKSNRGILGLVDESYFNSTALGGDDIDGDVEEDDYEEVDMGTVDKASSISKLSQSFNAPSSIFSNREVREMYVDSKAADQAGDRVRAKSILKELREATPHDMRVVRRLARLEQEDGNQNKAREILLEGLSDQPSNAHLLHGLGQLERTVGNDQSAKNYYRRAIENNPGFPNSYHALGTLEHTHGNIREALSVIKDGLKHCPRNHRLYHALGDVYLDANMLNLAEEAYLTGIQHGPEWSKCFFYASLSYVAYADGHVKDCRALLRQSLEVNGGMHAQGVIALAQLEESEGNIQEARMVYRDATMRYEKKRRRRSPISIRDSTQSPMSRSTDSDMERSPSYSGDKWVNVFKSWARMEEIHGTYETAHIVQSKAIKFFPNNVSLLIQWANLQASNGDIERARLLYEAACHLVGGRSTHSYQVFAEFEMRMKNFEDAKSILKRGAKLVRESTDGTVRNSGLAHLYHALGVCEYKLRNCDRAESSFEDALRVTGSEEEDSALRSLILYSMARLEYQRKEYLIAQHCIGLSLKENLLPCGNHLIWAMWYMIAEKMGNDHLAARCKEQALMRWKDEQGGAMTDLSRLLSGRKFRERESGSANLPGRTGAAMKDMFRKTPWHQKVCPSGESLDKTWHQGAKLWSL